MQQNICYSRGCVFEKKDGEIFCSILHNSAKLDVYNYLENYPPSSFIPNYVEVRFKNSRKDIFINRNKIPLKKGDIVAVEAQVGHDIGIVNAVGEIVLEQIRVKELTPDNIQKIIYRKAKPADLEKWYQAISLEHSTMIRSRQIAKSLGLEMKIGDVEYQGDKSKAIFYYIADDRVDFRELIKLLAAEFRVKIEMKQIGARQEAGRIGGMGSCGRELCCSTWMHDFVSVPTTAARLQELTPNPQKLTGQCGKLKCCLNFELDVYIDARKHFPNAYETLYISDGELYCQKIDIFRAIFWYSKDKETMFDLLPLSLEQVKNIISQNEKGIKPDLNNFIVKNINNSESSIDFSTELNEESVDRFDKKNNKKRNKKFGN
ncbi:MAG: PSP1 domain-containing protein [Bacteroidales bacterium]